MRRSDRGQAMVEFAFVIALFLMIIFGVIDLGRAIQAQNQLAVAAREGARAAALTHNADGSTRTDAQIREAAKAAVGLVTLSDGNIAVDPAGTRTSGLTVTVTASYSFTVVTPLVSLSWGGGPIPLRGKSTAVVE
ncbi:MAG: pilus assembly protein [Chloroflexi bacterium]|nr:pilus assembly protein [Chloroflexota bacterium]